MDVQLKFNILNECKFHEKKKTKRQLAIFTCIFKYNDIYLLFTILKKHIWRYQANES